MVIGVLPRNMPMSHDTGIKNYLLIIASYAVERLKVNPARLLIVS
jgi:hypothetical protein